MITSKHSTRPKDPQVQVPDPDSVPVAVDTSLAVAPAAVPVPDPDPDPAFQSAHTHPAHSALGPAPVDNLSCSRVVVPEAEAAYTRPIQHHLDCLSNGCAADIELGVICRMVEWTAEIGVEDSKRCSVEGWWKWVERTDGFVVVDEGRWAFGMGRPLGGSLLTWGRQHLARRRVGFVVAETAAVAAEAG